MKLFYSIKSIELLLLSFLFTLSFLFGKSPIVKFLPIENDFTSAQYTLFYFTSILFIVLFAVIKLRKVLKKEYLLFPIILMSLTIEMTYSLNMEEAIYFYLALFFIAIILLLLASIPIQEYRIFIKYFINFKIFFSTLIIILALIKMFLFGLESFENQRLSIFGGPNIFIRFVFFDFLFVMIFFKNRILKPILMIFLIVVLFLSGSKASLVILIIYFFFNNRKIFLVLMTIIIFIFSTMPLEKVIRYIPSGTIVRAIGISDVENKSNSTEGRLKNFIYTYENFQDHPLFGIGLYSYPVLNNYKQPHPHNLILELINYGLIYLILFMSIIIYMSYKSSIFHKRDNFYEELIRQSSIYFFIFIMLSGDLFYSKDFYIMLYLYYILIDKKNNLTKKDLL